MLSNIRSTFCPKQVRDAGDVPEQDKVLLGTRGWRYWLVAMPGKMQI